MMKPCLRKKYKVIVTNGERQKLTTLVNKGKSTARKITRARILLLANASEAGSAWSDERIVEALGISRRTVERYAKSASKGG